MSLKLAREAAFKALFQLDFTDNIPDDEIKSYEDLAIKNAVEDIEDLSENHFNMLEEKVRGTRKFIPEIDEIIKNNLKKGWTIKRLATADRNILRLAVYEMKFADEKSPPAVAIDEAVRFAKKYGTDSSGKFINGILEAISK